MSKNQTKALKRRLSESSDEQNKRTRLEEPAVEESKSKKSKGKNIAADRLALLRQNFSKSNERATFKKDTVRNIDLKINSISPSTKGNLYPKNEEKVVSTPPSSAKGSSINERLRKARLKSTRKSDDDIIIVIDDSPGPVLNRDGHNQKAKKSAKFVRNRSGLVDSSRSVANNSSVRSFVTISEASDAEGSCATLTPINQRLSRIKGSSSSHRSSKTITPGSSNEVLLGSQKDGEPSRVSRSPLKRNLFEVRKAAHRNATGNSSCDLKGAEAQVTSSAPVVETHGGCSDDSKLITNNNDLFTSSGGASMRPQVCGLSNAELLLGAITGSRSFKPLDQLNLPREARSTMVESWVESVLPQSSTCDQTINDSMLVNVDDTLLNKSELMMERQEDVSMDWDAMPDASDVGVCPKAVPPKENVICVVTDTNVFMHDLPKVRDLLNLKVTGDQKLKVYVPWMVLQELDYHKDGAARPVKSIALAAQKFINKHLAQPNSSVIGQSVDDVCQQRDLGRDPDNKILACCLQAQDKYASVMLLSNDFNLRNKALSNNVKAYSPKEILGQFRGGKFPKIKVRLQALLSQIILASCREAFGDACSKMDMLQDCPWSFDGCLKRFKKYWGTVFQQLLLKQCLKTIEELISYTNRGDIMDSDQQGLNRFKEKVKEFLFYLQDIDQFNDSVKKVRREVDTIVEGVSSSL